MTPSTEAFDRDLYERLKNGNVERMRNSLQKQGKSEIDQAVTLTGYALTGVLHVHTMMDMVIINAAST